MAASEKPQIITPPNTLGVKIPSQGGPDLKAIMSDAEAALEDLEEDYHRWVLEDLDAAAEALATATADADQRTAMIEKLFDICHNIKGQAATFGFPLLTLIAQSVCALITADQAGAEERLPLIRSHIDAMKVVASQNIRGPGGKLGEELVSTLHVAVKKALAG
ncbi:MAG: Hpt domain-containing protein [Kiloniellales bacterium]|nr:Hpt domain-containing protein [Kiloniellales bacterium]